MPRGIINPRDYGVDLDLDNFAQILTDELAGYTQGTLSVDEILLRPRAALHFCERIRYAFSWFDLPDDVILRAILDHWGKPRPPD